MTEKWRWDVEGPQSAFRQVRMRQISTAVYGEWGAEAGQAAHTVEVWFATREDPHGYNSLHGYGATLDEAVARLYQCSQEGGEP